MHAGFWWGNLRGRGHLEDPDVDGMENIKKDLQDVGWVVWSGLMWMWDRCWAAVNAVMNRRFS